MPKGSRVRPARLEEHEAVASCVRAAYSKYVGRIGREPAPMLADYAALIREGVVHVLEEGGSVAAVLVLKQMKNALLVENVAVHPAKQGLGLGRGLMCFAERLARDGELGELTLYTNELMTENLAFYARLGFEETGRRVEDGYQRVFLRKEL